MNERIAVDTFMPATTQAAEGLPRRLWTLAEIEAMVAAGIVSEDERFELIGGEVVPMSPKGARHELVKIELNEHLQRVKSNDLRVAPETTLRLDEKTFLEPDFCVFPRSVSPGDMRGPDVLLAIEISDTSLAYDRGRKASVYAAFGIPEIWVIDANRLVTYVYGELGAEGYRSVTEVPASKAMEARRAASIRVTLGELELKPLKRHG